MKKSTQNKINKLYLKVFCLKQEFDSLIGEIKSEYNSAEAKFKEIEEKYNATDYPSDSLQDKYDTAEEKMDELQQLVDDLEYCDFGDYLGTIEPYCDGIPEEIQPVKLNEKPKIPNEFKLHVIKREHIKSSNTFVLHLEVWTDIYPIPVAYAVYWDAKSHQWHECLDSKLPWLGGGKLYKQYIETCDSLYSQLFNSTEDLTATYEREA